MARLGDAGHARVGWAERLAETDAPVGADASGYAYCDVGGEKVHAGRREPYGEAFVAGDVVGCYLEVTRGEATRDAADAEEADAASRAAAADLEQREGAAPVSVDGALIPREAPEGEGSDPRRRARGRRGAARDGDGVRERDAPATKPRKAPTRIRVVRRARAAAHRSGVAGRGVRAARLRADHLSQRVPSVRVALHARQGGRAPRREGGVQLWADVRVPGFDIPETRRAAPDVRRGEGARGAAAKRRSDANRHRGASTVRYAYNIPTARATSASWFSSPRLWPRPA